MTFSSAGIAQSDVCILRYTHLHAPAWKRSVWSAGSVTRSVFTYGVLLVAGRVIEGSVDGAEFFDFVLNDLDQLPTLTTTTSDDESCMLEQHTQAHHHLLRVLHACASRHLVLVGYW